MSKKCLDLPPADASKGDTIFEYTVSDDGQWVHWNSLVTQYNYPEDSIPRYKILKLFAVTFNIV